MQDLQQSLQLELGTAYTIERELGGGGMSRVFVARDHKLARQVVAHIVPVLSAADFGGLPRQSPHHAVIPKKHR